MTNTLPLPTVSVLSIQVHDEQSQWIGPYAFAYKAEVDFDGTFLAAKLLKRYEGEFMGKERYTFIYVPTKTRHPAASPAIMPNT